ncbi:hypothetical protein ACWGJB_23280 [Streptomyces sp. NPDC054813]
MLAATAARWAAVSISAVWATVGAALVMAGAIVMFGRGRPARLAARRAPGTRADSAFHFLSAA